MSNLLKDNKELMKEFDFEKNRLINLDIIKMGTDKRIWWKCVKCNYSWQASPYSRKIGKGKCPACLASNGKGHQLVIGLNDLDSWCKKNNKDYILKEWCYSKNYELDPQKVTYGSSRMVWWVCEKGHKYLQRINHKTGNENCGCPYCTGTKVLYGYNDLDSWCKNNNRLDILLEFNNANNNEIPSKILYTSTKKFNFVCPFGHTYKREIYEKTLNFAQCPVCQKSNKVSLKEKTVYYYLKKFFPDTIENYIIDGIDTRKELDIFIPSIQTGVEYDGQFYHKDHKRDYEKNSICREKNINLYRIRESSLIKLPNCFNICLNDESNKSLEKAIESLLSKLGVSDTNININRDSVDIQNLVIKYNVDNSLKKWCVDNHKEYLLDEWDQEKNGNITPENVSYGSQQRFYFLCPKGHSYLQSVSRRTKDNVSCPYCSSKKILAGFNDFETWCHQNKQTILLEEWNYDKNKDVTPKTIAHGSTRKVWWKCKNNHEWLASLNNRSRGRKCPICSNKIIVNGLNDLSTTHPDVLKMWDQEKNGKRIPSDFSNGSSYMAWWMCPICKNSWQQRISHIAKGIGCPNCHYSPYKKNNNK